MRAEYYLPLHRLLGESFFHGTARKAFACSYPNQREQRLANSAKSGRGSSTSTPTGSRQLGSVPGTGNLARQPSRFCQDQRLVSETDRAHAAHPQFTTTHWSMVLSAGVTSAPAARDALERLCRTYWFPLYAFIRRLGHSPTDAQDLTQGFFVYLLERQLVAKADRQAGRFRSFLLGSLKHFLAHEHERATALKRGGGRVILSFDIFEPEERYALEPSDAATPEAIFDQRWALEQIENALKHLRAEYASSGRGALFDLLKDYVWGDQNALTLAEIAERLDLTEEAVKKSVQRLRQRFRDSLRAEVAQTIATPDLIDEELRHLRAALTAVG